jgi:hypothetical protein
MSGAVKCSVRKIAEIVGISKSSTHRSMQSMKKRNLHPESYFWETEEGEKWLKLLYYGTIIYFVVYGGIGAERLSRFFAFIRINHRVAPSPSKIREVADEACGLLAKYQQEQENQHQVNTPLKIVGGVDETYFDLMILVLMDLPSGYIFLEEESEDKSYDTWLDLANNVASRLNLTFKYFVSDRAKQLIKLATQGFETSSIPDLFHASHELVKLFGFKFNRMKKAIEDKLSKEWVTLALLNELSEGGHSQVLWCQTQVVMRLQIEQVEINKGVSKYRDLLHRISILLHPFDIKDSSPVTSAMIETLLLIIVEEGENLRDDFDISSKTDHLKKFKKQVRGMASLIDTWWIWVNEYFQESDYDEELKSWIIQYLLPFLYWKKQSDRTKAPALKERYRHAADESWAALDGNPLSKKYMEKNDIISGAEWMISNFQRTSSAVEGRNGWLSQMNHTGRGISPKRLKAQTVLHNYYLKREDGRTAAERLFHQQFPDPLEWVIDRMGELPLPRNRVSQ